METEKYDTALTGFLCILRIFILNDNNAFFSKIDSMLIDLTKDDEDENKIVNNGKTSFYISFKDILLNESFIF